MQFEYDPNKSQINLRKHGIDFESAKRLWSDGKRAVIEAPYPVESRYILIAELDKRLWSAVYTHRHSKIRIISVRRSRKREKELYETEKDS